MGIVVLLSFSALAATGCGGEAPSATEASGSFEGIHRPELLDVSGVSMTDARTGSPVAIPAQPGGITLVYFGYTHCPDICPTTLSDLRLAMADIGPLAEQVTTVFVTADPGRDTADVMDRYVGSFLDRYSVVRISDASALDAVEKPFQASTSVGPTKPDGSYDVSHTALVYAVDSAGKVQVEWPFGTSPDTFAHDLRLLLQQAPAT